MKKEGKKRKQFLTVCTFLVLFLAVNLLQMLDLNVTIAFPAAPLFTVILSLVGKFYTVGKTTSNICNQLQIIMTSISLWPAYDCQIEIELLENLRN